MAMKTYTDSYYRKLYDVLHQSVDRIIEAAATVQVHGDILSVDDDDDDDDDDFVEVVRGDEEEDPQGDDTESSPSGGTALKLLKAQLQSKGGDKDIPLLQSLVSITSNLLILHSTRLKIQQNHQPHQ
jgi:hypothetical protein